MFEVLYVGNIFVLVLSVFANHCDLELFCSPLTYLAAIYFFDCIDKRRQTFLFQHVFKLRPPSRSGCFFFAMWTSLLSVHGICMAMCQIDPSVC